MRDNGVEVVENFYKLETRELRQTREEENPMQAKARRFPGKILFQRLYQTLGFTKGFAKLGK